MPTRDVARLPTTKKDWSGHGKAVPRDRGGRVAIARGGAGRLPGSFPPAIFRPCLGRQSSPSPAPVRPALSPAKAREVLDTRFMHLGGIATMRKRSDPRRVRTRGAAAVET